MPQLGLYGPNHPGTPPQPAREREPAPPPLPEGLQTRNRSYQRLRASGTLSEKQLQYLAVMARAAEGRLVDNDGRDWADLTDKEAAKWLQHLTGDDWPPSTVSARRNELSANSNDAEIRTRPLVIPARKRRCRVSGHTAQAWIYAGYNAFGNLK